jgi:hypothetical protein
MTPRFSGLQRGDVIRRWNDSKKYDTRAMWMPAIAAGVLVVIWIVN